jgi:PEP-CTERM motif
LKALLAASVLAGIAGFTASAARADMIIETYTFPSPLVGYTLEAGSLFSEFNPALGTLNSVTLNNTATATFSGGGGTDFNEALYQISLDGNTFVMLAFITGNGTADTSIHNFTSTFNLAAYIGTEELMTSVLVINDNETIANISSTFGTQTLIYNFTPVTPAPEPSSLLLFAGGLLAAGWAYRRRMGARG